MNKLLQKIENLKNQNSSDMSFDFLRKDKAVKTPKKSKLKSFLGVFIFSQILFTIANINNFNNFIHNKVDDGNNTYHDFSALQEATKLGNQQESIIDFAEFVKSESAVNDLLAGGFILSVLTQNQYQIPENATEKEKNIIEKNRFKITPETQKILLNIYKENWKNGLTEDKKVFNNYKCFMFDLSCIALKKAYEKTVMQELNIIEQKIKVAHYDVEHIEAYKKWQVDFWNIMDKNTKLDINSQFPLPKSPGELAFPKKEGNE